MYVSQDLFLRLYREKHKSEIIWPTFTLTDLLMITYPKSYLSMCPRNSAIKKTTREIS